MAGICFGKGEALSRKSIDKTGPLKYNHCIAMMGRSTKKADPREGAAGESLCEALRKVGPEHFG